MHTCTINFISIGTCNLRTYNKMAATESKYVLVEKDESDKDIVTILEDGHINRSNISSMNFVFGQPSNITASLEKANAENPDPDAPKSKGQIGHASIEVQYPDQTKSSKVVFNDCIIQYRERSFGDLSKVRNKQTALDYGVKYVQIGIPITYLDKVFADASKHNVSLGNRENTKEKDHHYWVNCDIKKIPESNISIIYEADGETNVINQSIRSVLQAMESSIKCTITFSLSCVITTSSKDTAPDLKGGRYHATIKPFEILMEEDSKIKGPELSDVSNNTKNESSEKTEKNLAKGKLLEMALGRLKIN